MDKELWKGNEAIAEAAVRAGCKGFFGYPITPQNEIPEYMSRRMPEAGGVFVQSESELAAINMLYGAAATGVRAMTSSSSPGISLKQEGISYMVGAELPGVIVNVMRGGPGLGSIQPSQCDYYQATRGGGNGDYRTIVLAPNSVQEAADMVQEAFDLADQYRNPVLVLVDGMIGQMMEPIVWADRPGRKLPPKDWAASGRKNRTENRFINSLLINAKDCEKHNLHLQKKYDEMERSEKRWEEYNIEDGQILIVAYGTPSRIAATAIAELEKMHNIKAALFRPMALWPFPESRLHDLAARDNIKAVLTVEMSLGQMIDDVRLSVCGCKPISFLGRSGGSIPTVKEVVEAALNALKEAE